MSKKQNNQFWLQFAGLSCRVTSPLSWKTYLTKRFTDTNVRILETVPSPLAPWIDIVFINTRYHSNSMEARVEDKDMTVTITVSGPDDFFYPLIAHLVQRVFTILFYYHGGIVLHASAVESQGKAYVFAGISGKGKTTIAGLSHELYGCTILADNQVFLLKEKDSYTLYPFPFDSFHSRQASRPIGLHHILILEQSRKHAIKKLSFDQKFFAVKNTIQFQVPKIHSQTTSPGLRAEFTRRLFALSSSANISQLYFAKKRGFWEVISET